MSAPPCSSCSKARCPLGFFSYFRPHTLKEPLCLILLFSAFVFPSLPACLWAEPQQPEAELESSPGSHTLPGALLCSPWWSRGLYNRGTACDNWDNIAFSLSGLSLVPALSFGNWYHVVKEKNVSELLPEIGFIKDSFKCFFFLKTIYNCEGFMWEIEAWERSGCLLGPWKARHWTYIPAAPSVITVSLRLYKNILTVCIFKC